MHFCHAQTHNVQQPQSTKNNRFNINKITYVSVHMALARRHAFHAFCVN